MSLGVGVGAGTIDIIWVHSKHGTMSKEIHTVPIQDDLEKAKSFVSGCVGTLLCSHAAYGLQDASRFESKGQGGRAWPINKAEQEKDDAGVADH